jgi:hypothetical protein
MGGGGGVETGGWGSKWKVWASKQRCGPQRPEAGGGRPQRVRVPRDSLLVVEPSGAVGRKKNTPSPLGLGGRAKRWGGKTTNTPTSP